LKTENRFPVFTGFKTVKTGNESVHWFKTGFKIGLKPVSKSVSKTGLATIFFQF
jgi:hypothetical protein